MTNGYGESKVVGVISAEVEALLKAGAALGGAKKHDNPDARAYAVIPEGWQVAQLPTATWPERLKGDVKLGDMASFVRYFMEHKTPASRIYGNMDPASFLAVFDDIPSVAESTDGPRTDWREFRCSFALDPSREWAVWTSSNKRALGQVPFAEFIQDNLPDVVQPDAGALMEMALNFQSTEDGSLVSSVRLENGNSRFAIRSETKLAEGIIVPEYIELKIPVFEYGKSYPLRARLRYRAKDKLLFWYELERPHKVKELAFKEIWGAIEAGTNLNILLGSPE